MTTPATFTKNSICICGFPILDEDIPLGTPYQIDEDNRCVVLMICGGCGLHYPGVELVWVEGRGEAEAGYLPWEIFETETNNKPQEKET